MHQRPESWESPERGLSQHRSGVEQAYQLMAGGEITQGMQTLFASLARTRAVLEEPEWKRFCEDCRRHPIRELVHQDPITERSFTKPRGYSGDAVLMDMMYGRRTRHMEAATPLGQVAARYVYGQPSAQSVRERRELLARKIDTVAQETPDARILSVACGHLREAPLSAAVRERRLGQFLALDQDPRSLAVVEQELASHGIQVVPGSVRTLLKGETRFTGLDFIYAAGLYDYLPQPVALQLTRVLFSMLRSGGRLLVANYTDGAQDAGYMEAFMDWWLLYREQSEVEAWLQDVPRRELSGYHFQWDSLRNVLYLEAVRR
jgi:SAM-dependent methyltransferase